MAEYHVQNLGKQIYAGQVVDGKWIGNSVVTDECTAAVAEWLVDNKVNMQFTLDNTRYVLQVKRMDQA